jgi:hypothetical protein
MRTDANRVSGVQEVSFAGVQEVSLGEGVSFAGVQEESFAELGNPHLDKTLLNMPCKEYDAVYVLGNLLSIPRVFMVSSRKLSYVRKRNACEYHKERHQRCTCP